MFEAKQSTRKSSVGRVQPAFEVSCRNNPVSARFVSLTQVFTAFFVLGDQYESNNSLRRCP